MTLQSGTKAIDELVEEVAKSFVHGFVDALRRELHGTELAEDRMVEASREKVRELESSWCFASGNERIFRMRVILELAAELQTIPDDGAPGRVVIEAVILGDWRRVALCRRSLLPPGPRWAAFGAMIDAALAVRAS